MLHNKHHTLAAICTNGTIRVYADCAPGMLWTDDKLRQTIAQFRPVLLLHKDEQYLPCSVEWYNERSELWLQQPNQSSQASRCSHAVHSHHHDLLSSLLHFRLCTPHGCARCLPA